MRWFGQFPGTRAAVFRIKIISFRGTTTMAKINIDNVEYDTESLSDEALAQLQSIQFVDSEVAKLQGRIAAMNTARIAYSNALLELLAEDLKEIGENLTAS